TCNITLNTDTTQTLTLALKPTLSLTMNGSGSVLIGGLSGASSQVTCTSTCTEFLDPGSSISLTPTGTTSTYFSTWGGDCASTGSLCNLYVDGPKAVIANFLQRISLTAATAGSGQGTIGSNDGQLGCPSACVDAVVPGTAVTLYANAGTNSVFAGWS